MCRDVHWMLISGPREFQSLPPERLPLWRAWGAGTEVVKSEWAKEKTVILNRVGVG